MNSTVSLKTFGSIWSSSRLIVSSHPRIKKDVQQLDIKESIDIVKKIVSFRYTRIEDNVIGYSAKNIETLMPEAINNHESNTV